MSVPTFDWTGEVTAAHRQAYEEVGAVRFKGFAPPREVAALRVGLDALSDRWVGEDRRFVHGIPIKYGQRSGQRFVQRFAFTSLHSPAFAELMKSGRFEAVRAMFGDEFRVGELEKDGVVVNHYRNDEGSRYTRLGWHTDGLRDLFYCRLPGPMVNVGLYLDDSPEENGALRILPGTHRQGFRSMCLRKAYFVDHRADPDECVVEASAGDLTLHDGRLWHRVARSERTGDASTRRTAYVPVLCGPSVIKTESSPTPFYHRFQWITG